MNEVELDLMFAPEEGLKTALNQSYGLRGGTANLASAAGNVELRLRPLPANQSSNRTLSGVAEVPLILPYVTVLAAPLGAALGVWLKERYGRKVRLKVGDIEAEAGTTEEIEKLLARAQELQASQRTEPHP